MNALVTGLFVLLTGTTAAQAAETGAVSVPSSDRLHGKWSGPWASQRSNGQMEIEVQTVENGRITGRVIVTYAGRTNCSTEWEKLVGTQSGEKVVAHYDLGGSCGKVDATFSIDAGSVATGTWSNQYGGNGTLRLTKQ